MPIEPYLFYLQIYIRGLDMLNINYILGAIISFTSLTVQAEVNWKSLNLDNAIVEKKGNGKKQIAIITDTGCGYCRQLEQQLQPISNVTIYRFLAPFRGSKSEAISIWCANDRNQALKNKMLYNQSPILKQCSNPLQTNINMAYRLNIIGTPMLIKPNGDVNYAMSSSQEIVDWLNQHN